MHQFAKSIADGDGWLRSIARLDKRSLKLQTMWETEEPIV